MNEPAEYVFRGRHVRIITDRQRVPWFIAKDVCDILGTDTKDLRAILDTDEITNLDTIDVQPTAGRPFAFEPTCKITRRGLALLWQRVGAERMRTQLDYNHDTLDIHEGA